MKFKAKTPDDLPDVHAARTFPLIYDEKIDWHIMGGQIKGDKRSN
jgi:hypothetical protein